MRDEYTFRMFTDITVTKEDVIEFLSNEGFFDKEVTKIDEDGEYTDIIYDEEAAANYEPDYDDYEKVALQWWKNDNCEYYGPDPV